MDVLTLCNVILRRWAIVVPVLLVTAVAAYQVSTRIQPEYEAAGSVLLVDAASSGATDAAAADGGTPPVTGGVIAEIVQGDAVSSALKAEGNTASYTVESDADGSILRVTATSDDEDAVVPTADAVLGAIVEQATKRQDAAGVAPADRFTVDILAAPAAAELQLVEDPQAEEPVRQYVASGSALLRPPGSDGVWNPYGASTATAQILAQVLGSDQGRQRVSELGSTSSYTVGQERQDDAPILYVSTTGNDPSDVLGTFHDVVEALDAELAERQEAFGVRPALQVGVDPLAVPAAATSVSGGELRPLITIVGLGVAAAMGLAILVDGLLVARGRRARRRRQDAEPAGDATQPPATWYERVG